MGQNLLRTAEQTAHARCVQPALSDEGYCGAACQTTVTASTLQTHVSCWEIVVHSFLAFAPVLVPEVSEIGVPLFVFAAPAATPLCARLHMHAHWGVRHGFLKHENGSTLGIPPAQMKCHSAIASPPSWHRPSPHGSHTKKTDHQQRKSRYSYVMRPGNQEQGIQPCLDSKHPSAPPRHSLGGRQIGRCLSQSP